MQRSKIKGGLKNELTNPFSQSSLFFAPRLFYSQPLVASSFSPLIFSLLPSCLWWQGGMGEGRMQNECEKRDAKLTPPIIQYKKDCSIFPCTPNLPPPLPLSSPLLLFLPSPLFPNDVHTRFDEWEMFSRSTEENGEGEGVKGGGGRDGASGYVSRYFPSRTVSGICMTLQRQAGEESITCEGGGDTCWWRNLIESREDGRRRRLRSEKCQSRHRFSIGRRGIYDWEWRGSFNCIVMTPSSTWTESSVCTEPILGKVGRMYGNSSSDILSNYL